MNNKTNLSTDQTAASESRLRRQRLYESGADGSGVGVPKGQRSLRLVECGHRFRLSRDVFETSVRALEQRLERERGGLFGQPCRAV
eukprot:6205320-Pleurochrysis_carterae.AAC.1